MNYKYYSQQSVISDPVLYGQLFDDLPSDIRELCGLLQQFMLHFLDAEQLAYDIPASRLSELDLRHANKLLKKIMELDDQPLHVTRDMEKKLIGCCRDFSLLLCSILRHKNIPARLRFGFSTFQIPGFHHDQVLLEYWDQGRQRWNLVDARINSIFIKKHHIMYKSHEVTKNAFLTAGEAWQLCRSGAKSADRFGTGKSQKMRGWWFIRNKLLQDFAALNKYEMLLWDSWGMMLDSLSNDFLFNQRQMNLLDTIANLTSKPEIDVDLINEIYAAEEELHVKNKIYSDSMNGGRTIEM